MNEEAKTALIRARTALYIDQPLYGILALRLTMVEDTSIPTLCVNHKVIKYNPEFVLNGLTGRTRKSAIAHEVSHVMLNHIGRRAGRDPKKWGAAGDYVINAQLKQDGFELGPEWLYSPQFAGKSADEVYTLLPDKPDGGESNSKNGAPDGWGELDEMEDGGDPDDAAAEALDWKVATISALKQAANQGKTPASMKRLLDELTNNKINWRAKLRRFATETSKRDYSWSRPQRRMLPYGLVLPSLYSEAMGTMVTGIDTSGSISKFVLNAFGAEVLAARNAVQPDKLVNIYCDAAVAHVDTYDQFDQVTFEGHGGGGTDFRPPFQYVADNGLTPACFIYLTDGEGPFPESPPPYPVLWCITTDIVAPWGETVRIEV